MSRPVSTTSVQRLGAIDGDVRLVGGKAASLDRLARLGFRIPPGFCLTTEAFHEQLASIAAATAMLGALPDEAARAGLTQAFETTPLEAHLRADLDGAVGALVAEVTSLGGSPLFAVRSSGIGEDGTNASFAGLHETELGVTPGGVEAAVRRCWASLWSAPALAYRVRKGLALDGGGMAVVVQALVPADAAAVVFTRHPVTATDDIVITAVHGLGESMVAGTVTPDTFVVDRLTLEVVEFEAGDASGRLVADDAGGTSHRAGEVSGPSLDASAVRELADLSLAVERGFGAPVDIEAAIVAGRWYLLQARPITTR